MLCTACAACKHVTFWRAEQNCTSKHPRRACSSAQCHVERPCRKESMQVDAGYHAGYHAGGGPLHLGHLLAGFLKAAGCSPAACPYLVRAIVRAGSISILQKDCDARGQGSVWPRQRWPGDLRLRHDLSNCFKKAASAIVRGESKAVETAAALSWQAKDKPCTHC